MTYIHGRASMTDFIGKGRKCAIRTAHRISALQQEACDGGKSAAPNTNEMDVCHRFLFALSGEPNALCEVRRRRALRLRYTPLSAKIIRCKRPIQIPLRELRRSRCRVHPEFAAAYRASFDSLFPAGLGRWVW